MSADAGGKGRPAPDGWHPAADATIEERDAVDRAASHEPRVPPRSVPDSCRSGVREVVCHAAGTPSTRTCRPVQFANLHSVQPNAPRSDAVDRCPASQSIRGDACKTGQCSEFPTHQEIVDGCAEQAGELTNVLRAGSPGESGREADSRLVWLEIDPQRELTGRTQKCFSCVVPRTLETTSEPSVLVPFSRSGGTPS